MECIMRNIKLPDWFTMLNAVMGLVATLMIVNGRFDVAAMLIIIASFLDGVDGAVARRFESGDFGEYLDSFADLISFGFVPALLLSTAIKWDHPYILSLIHISEPTRLGMISYAVFCLKKKKKKKK